MKVMEAQQAIASGSAREGPADDRAPDIQRAIALTLFFILLVGCFVVLRPFIAAILWAAILAVATWPLFRRLERLLNGRRTLAGLLMILGLGAILLLPLLLLGAQLENEVIQLVAVVRSLPDSGLPPPPAWLADLPIGGQRLDTLWRSYDIEGLRAALNENIGPVRDWVLARGAAIGEGILQIILSLITAFFFYRDGPALVGLLQRAMAKVAGSYSGGLSATSRATINGVARGVLGTAVIQAILLAIGFALAGVPAPIFLGFLAFFLSLIPAGLALLWVPAAAWLAVNGMQGAALFVAVWGAVVGFLDNFTRPYLMAGQTGLPFLLILLGVIGGALSFGLVGLFLGPIFLAIALNMVREWVGAPKEERA